MKSQKLMMTRVAMLLLAVFTSMGAWADESGSCGDGVTYTYVSDTNTLIISYSGSGSGAMADYTLPTLEDPGTPAPWSDEMNFPFTTLIIEEGVTTIGNYAFTERPYFLENVTLSSTVQTIGEFAFDYCPNIKALTIPSSVTSIGNNAFSNCGALATVTFDSGTSSLTIGDRAFKSCISLTSITIPSRVTSIGDAAFDTCEKLASITIPSGVANIGNYAFWDCDALTSITIPSSVTSIGNCAFINCGALSTVVMLPETPPTCGNDAFLDNKTGRKIYVPYESLEDYEEAANWSAYRDDFYGYIGTGDCGKTSSDNVNWVSTGLRMVIYGSGAMADYGSTENVPWYSDRDDIKTVVVGSGVTHIGVSSFYGCVSLESVTIPSSVTSIGNFAFYGCHGINSLTLPDNLTTIGNNAFYNCSAIPTLNIPNSVTSIGNQAFWECYSLICVTIGTGVTSIGYSAFEDCTHLATVVVFATSVPTLGNENVFGNNADGRYIYVPDGSWETYKSNWNAYSADISSFEETGDCSKTSSDNVKWVSAGSKMVVYGSGAMADYSSSGQGPWPIYDTPMRVIIEEGVTTIGNYAFAGHGKITHTVTIPNTVQTIGTNAFSGCSKLKTLVIGSGVKTISDHAFYNCHNIDNLTLPDGLKTIGDHAFYRCSNITSLTLPDGVETIGNSAFNSCMYIPSVTIPSSVTRIGNYAFDGCSELATVTFAPASSVTTIGNYAFSDCAKLESITIPSSVTSIGERVFGGCSKLTSISVEGGNTVYDSGNGCNAIIKTSSHTLIAGCQNTTIPNTVTSIGNYAFDEVSGLTSIEIPSSVTSLGEGAFYDCDLLASITIPSSVTNIGDDVFYNCSALSTVVILPASLTTYGKRVFESNKSDRKIYVPNGSLGTYQTNWSAYSSAIYGYTGAGDCGDNVKWVFADMDGNSTGETMVIYGSGAMADYTQQNQAPWYGYDFTTLNIEEGVTTIGNYAFQNCNGINTVNLPGKVTSIGNYAFDNAGLTSATLNSNPTIGGYAFGSGVALTMNLAASASNGYKWASFFNDYCNFQVDENTTVFKAKSNGEKVTLTAIADGIIPAGTAVVLRTPTDSSPVLTNTSSSTSGSYEDNELKGSSTAVTQEGAHTYYALAVKSGNVGLYKVKSSAKIPAGKAYLEDVIATTRDFLAFEDSEPTGIVDGRWKMEEGRGDGWYTLDGRKLNGKPKKKGMYVVNGNKVVIK